MPIATKESDCDRAHQCKWIAPYRRRDPGHGNRQQIDCYAILVSIIRHLWYYRQCEACTFSGSFSLLYSTLETDLPQDCSQRFAFD
jgi:hypothetical protein